MSGKTLSCCGGRSIPDCKDLAEFVAVGKSEIAPLPMHEVAILEPNLPPNPFFSDLG
jgi:hypothetical protein